MGNTAFRRTVLAQRAQPPLNAAVGRLRMPLFERTKNRLLMPLAILPVLNWCALPGIAMLPRLPGSPTHG